MTERSVNINGQAYSSGHVHEVATNIAQEALNDENASEDFKDAAVNVAVDAINHIPPPTED